MTMPELKPATTAPKAPRVFEGPWSEIEAAAQAEGAPLVKPVAAFADDRGHSLMNLFAGALTADGQVNYSVQFPGAVKAWHRHRAQTDFWCCVAGHLKVGVHRDADHPGGPMSWVGVIGMRRPAVVVIPPGLWHGAVACGAESASLLYFVTRRYDPAAPDEERMAWDAVADFPWGVRHG